GLPRQLRARGHRSRSDELAEGRRPDETSPRRTSGAQTSRDDEARFGIRAARRPREGGLELLVSEMSDDPEATDTGGSDSARSLSALAELALCENLSQTSGWAAHWSAETAEADGA